MPGQMSVSRPKRQRETHKYGQLICVACGDDGDTPRCTSLEEKAALGFVAEAKLLRREIQMARALLAGLLLLTTVTSLASGCATTAVASHQRDARRLRALERSFHAFVASPIADEHGIEAAVGRLEALRLDYLDALTTSVDEHDRLLALVRLAELHLDLSARIRRVPYVGVDDHVAFDARLSARALPLEATGISVLQQVDDSGSDHDRFVQRARLYLHLHTDASLTEADLDVLREELVAVSFRAPRSLLDTGRIGQRAARR